MTLEEIKKLLKRLNIPVAYNHFNSKVNPPYIAYLQEDTTNVFADNKVIIKITEIFIELYTSKKDIDLEERLECLLNDNEIPFEVEGETFIEEENVYEIIYKITI